MVKISIEYIEHMGSDMRVVNAARVSMNKRKPETGFTPDIDDVGLIKYLARENHFTPFCHPQITMVYHVPIFTARQEFKHVVGFCVTGDTEISFEKTHNLKNGTTTKSVKSLYEKWNAKTPHSRHGHEYGHREVIKSKKLRVLNTNTDVFENGTIDNIMFSGRKQVFKVTLSDGKQVTTSKDHRYLTPDGWKTLEDAVGLDMTNSEKAFMTKDAEFGVNGIHIANSENTFQNQSWLAQAKYRHGNLKGIADEAGCSTHTIRKWLQRFNLQFDQVQNLTGANGEEPWNKGAKGYRINHIVTDKHKALIRKARSGENSNFWKGGITSDRKNIGRWTTEQAKRVHRKYNFKCVNCNSGRDFDNLCTLCDICHKHIHSNNLELEFANNMNVDFKPVEKSTGGGNVLAVKYKKVVMIEYMGEKDVYDITVNHPSANFVGNGVVLHNSRNEISKRYVDDTPEIFQPDSWRMRPDKSIKQGSGDDFDEGDQKILFDDYDRLMNQIVEIYDHMIAAEVAPEQARMILPQSMMTSYYITGSLYAYSRMANLRLDGHAQKEIRDLAVLVSDVIEPLFPISWNELVKR